MNAPAHAFHAGERALQQRAGVRERMDEVGPRVLRDHMPEQHRTFFAQLPFLVVGSLDADGQSWASVLAAPPGFAHAPDARTLRVDALPAPTDPLAGNLRPGAALGVLGIEPLTRRRNRMNGVVDAVDARGFSVGVQQSFGNCPRYIQAREPVFVSRPMAASAPAVERLALLDAAARGLVARADTFFIATAHPGSRSASNDRAHGVDVSHRGGRPGFVQVDAEGRTLTVPDFAGNLFFNTLGNLSLDPRAGLVFVDFANGELLHVRARAEIVWEGPELDAFAGAERLLRLQVDGVLRRPAALPLRWGAAQPSPHLAGIGHWPVSRTAAPAR